MKLSILMPVYNEFATLTRAVKEVIEVEYPCEVELVIVDDGSTDGTRELYGSFALDPQVSVRLHESNRGKGAAIRTAAQAATGDYVIMCDADLEYSPAEIPRLLTPVLRGEAEVVYGTRAFSSHNSYSYLYVLGNKAVTTTANTLFNCYLSDLETCFKLMPRHLYLDLDVREQGFGMEAEITGKLLRRGIRPYEVPISYKARSREEGKKLTARDGAQALWILGRERVARIPRPSPAPEQETENARRRTLPVPDRLPAAAPGATGSWSWSRAEYWLVGMLAALTFAVHDVGYMLAWPFWRDEAWVAVTTRFPASALPAVTSSTPILWSLLLRPFMILGPPQAMRLLPLLFAAAAVAAAYVLGRGLGWRERWQAVLAGTLAAGATLLCPAMLVRDDLKQYTADVCFALIVLCLVSRLEREWTIRRLWTLAAVTVGGLLLSHTTLFVATAGFGALLLTRAAGRDWRQVAQGAAAAGAAAAGAATVYLLFDARAVVPGLITFWHKYFPPVGRGPGAVLHFLRFQLHHRLVDLGLGGAWLAAALVLLGLVALVKSARPALALTVALLVPEMFVLGALRVYPFLDLRTSTFLLVVIVVTAAVGVAWLCGRVAGDASDRRRLAALVLAAAFAVAFTAGASDRIRSHPVRLEDVRGQAAYVYLHRAPGDAILLQPETSVNFAYYWPGPLARTRSAVSLQGYGITFPGQPQIVSAGHADPARITAVLAEAVTRMRELHGTRIWAIGLPSFIQRPLWEEAYHEAGLDVRPVAGTHGLEVLVPRPAPTLTRSAEPGVSWSPEARKTVS